MTLIIHNSHRMEVLTAKHISKNLCEPYLERPRSFLREQEMTRAAWIIESIGWIWMVVLYGKRKAPSFTNSWKKVGEDVRFTIHHVRSGI